MRISNPVLKREVVERWRSRRAPMTLTIYLAVLTMVFNLLTDLLYQAVDPRVQLK